MYLMTLATKSSSPPPTIDCWYKRFPLLRLLVQTFPLLRLLVQTFPLLRLSVQTFPCFTTVGTNFSLFYALLSISCVLSSNVKSVLPNVCLVCLRVHARAHVYVCARDTCAALIVFVVSVIFPINRFTGAAMMLTSQKKTNHRFVSASCTHCDVEFICTLSYP